MVFWVFVVLIVFLLFLVWMAFDGFVDKISSPPQFHFSLIPRPPRKTDIWAQAWD